MTTTKTPTSGLDAAAVRLRADDPTMSDLGLLMLAFLTNWDAWVERRVESLTFPDEATFRRRVSVDFAIPEDWPSPLRAGEKGSPPTFYVPLTVLQKQGLTGFDLRDESGTALPLLTRDQNGMLAHATLAQLAEAIREDRRKRLTGDLPEEIHAELALITNGSADRAVTIWDAFSEPKEGEPRRVAAWRTFLAGEDKFMALAWDFALGFPLVVPITGSPGTRRIVKFSYEAPAPARGQQSLRTRLRIGLGWAPRTERVAVPTIGQGRCFHLEVQAPEGLMATRGKLSSSKPPRPTVWRGALPDVIKYGSERLHLHISAPQAARGEGIVNLRPRPATITRSAWATAILTSLALGATLLREDELYANVGPAASILLLVPTGLSVYIARPREPVVTTGLLLGQRLLAVVCGMLAVGASTVLVAGQECETSEEITRCEPWAANEFILAVLTGVAVLIVLLLSWSLYRTARPPEKRQEL
jgi:hypothetical protein